MVLQLTVFWYIGAVLGHVCLGLGVLALVTMLLSWVFFFPQWGLGVCVVLWSVGCKSIQFLVHSFNLRLAQGVRCGAAQGHSAPLDLEQGGRVA